jgi:hypothetical protein
MKADKIVISEIFSYLMAYEAQNPVKADGIFMFCRTDKRLAITMASLLDADLAGYGLIVGGIGKDSGVLADINLPEALYLASIIHWEYGIPDNRLLVESTASTGAEASRRGIETIRQSGRPHERLIMVAHPTSLRRLWAMHLSIAGELGFSANYQLVSTAYPFDPENPVDQREAKAELLRLANWPAKGWAVPQRDLPEDLVSWARK